MHIEAERLYDDGYEIILIGHAGHPEVIGTMGQLPSGAVHLVETLEDAATYTPNNADKLSYITQTTLSVDDTQEIVSLLKERFPAINHPKKEDICYATTNRQEAVKEVARECDCLLVVGAPNSSNSRRLVEVGERAGAKASYLVQNASEIPWDEITANGHNAIGITAGASAPEVLVDEIITAFQKRFATTVKKVTTATENVSFKLPRQLRDSG